MSAGPLTYDDLAVRWGCCERQAKRICRRLNLKPMRLGHRTVRFRPADVDLAEDAATTVKRVKPRAAPSCAKATEGKP